MTINIDALTEDELVDLNRRIVERLRFLQHMRAHKQMLEFRVGDRVTIEGDGRGTIEGMLTRYNRRTVTIVTDDGHQWNVSPSLLSKVTAIGKKPQAPTNVIRLK
jgi:ribosomal protein L21E